jgi:hypothetical protein
MKLIFHYFYTFFVYLYFFHHWSILHLVAVWWMNCCNCMQCHFINFVAMYRQGTGYSYNADWLYCLKAMFSIRNCVRSSCQKVVFLFCRKSDTFGYETSKIQSILILYKVDLSWTGKNFVLQNFWKKWKSDINCVNWKYVKYLYDLWYVISIDVWTLTSMMNKFT